MEHMVHQLKNKLSTAGVSVLEINLYDISVELIKKRPGGVWEKLIENDDECDHDELLKDIQCWVDSETHLIPAIQEKMKEKDFHVMFITGVGEVYPYIRSHNVLNNLQSKAKNHPTVMFFPGAYSYSLEHGASLDLFSILLDDKYYRAFNIFNCEIQQGEIK